jgi:hypothetical protein
MVSSNSGEINYGNVPTVSLPSNFSAELEVTPSASETSSQSSQSNESQYSGLYTPSEIQTAPGQLEGNQPTPLSFDSSQGIPGASPPEGPATVG